MSKIKRIQVVELDTTIIAPAIDWELLKGKFPGIFKFLDSKDLSDNLDPEEVIEELHEVLPDGSRWEDLVKKTESVVLHYDDGSICTIYNKDIISFNGREIDGYSINSDKNYVYFIITRVDGQAGSLGIWNIHERKWEFSYSNECFCVEAVVYVENLDAFVGSYSWNLPMGQGYGSGYFSIKDNKYEEFSLVKSRK